MPVSVTMPQLGESVTEGTVTRWLKQEGEPVEADEPLLEVSHRQGRHRDPLAQRGRARVDQGRRGRDRRRRGRAGRDLRERRPAGAAAPAAPQAAPPPPPPAPQAAPPPPPVAPAPALRRLPRAAGTTTAARTSRRWYVASRRSTTSTSPRCAVPASADASASRTCSTQRVTVRAATATPAPRPPLPPPPFPSQPLPQRRRALPCHPSRPANPRPPLQLQLQPQRPWYAARTEKLSRLRSVIATRMVGVLQISAQLTTVVEVDVTRIARLRERAKDDVRGPRGREAHVPAVLRQGRASRRSRLHPKVNAEHRPAAGTVTYHDAEHLGIAVDTERGLLVPVIHDAGDLNIGGLPRKIADLADRTRRKQGHPGRARRRHVHADQHRQPRRPVRHADHQPAAGRHPRHRHGRQAPGRHRGPGTRGDRSPSGRWCTWR